MNAEKRQRRAEYMRQWYSKHPEYQKQYQEKYKLDHDFQAAARKRASAWYEANKERAKKASLDRYHAKPKKGRPKAESHVNWKGDDVGYHALHIWVKRIKGSPQECEHCRTKDAKRYEWANIDHKYRRVLADYIRLCTSCHRRHDYRTGISNVGGRRKAE